MGVVVISYRASLGMMDEYECLATGFSAVLAPDKGR